jgi:hypothetical protein
MTWQDGAIAACQLVFVIALVPAVLGQEKPPRSTCALTGAPLLVTATALATLELWWAASTMYACAALWWTLFFQGRRA